MELSALAAKQKRIQAWSTLLDSEVDEAGLKSRFSSALDRYRATLVRVWKSGKISPQDEHELTDLERQLEQLDEEARLTVVGKKPLAAPLKRF